MIKEFAVKWDSRYGLTLDEAINRKNNVDMLFKVSDPKSNWNPAEIVPDYCKKGGYKVIITSK